VSYVLAISQRGEINLLIFNREDISVNLKPYTLHAASSNLYDGRDIMDENYHYCYRLIRINSEKVLG